MGKQRPIDLSGFDEIVKTNKPKELDLSGFDEIVKKKEDFQRGYQFGSKPLSAGSTPSQTQVGTKAPSVLLSDEQKQQREKQRIGERFETTLLNVPTEFGKVDQFMRSAKKVKDTLPQTPTIKPSTGGMVVIPQGEKIGDSLRKGDTLQDEFTDKLTGKKTALQKQIESAQEAFRTVQGEDVYGEIQDAQQLDNMSPERVEAERERKGNYVKFLYNQFLDGTGSAVSGLVDVALAIDKGMPLASPLSKSGLILDYYRKNNAKGVRNFLRDNIGAEVDKGLEAKYNEGMLTGAIGGLASSAPAMLTGGMTKGLSMVAQMYDGAIQSIESRPDADQWDNDTKTLFAGTLGLIQGQLEKYGLDKVLKGGELTNVIFKKILKSAEGKEITGNILENLIDESVKGVARVFAKGGVRAVDSFASEFYTGAGQEASAIGIESLFDKVTGKPIFDTSNKTNWIGFVDRIAKAGFQEGIGGFALGGGVGMLSRISKKKVKEAQAVINEIDRQLENPDTLPEVAEVLIQRKADTQANIDDIVDEEADNQSKMSLEDFVKSQELSKQIEKIDLALQDPNTGESVKADLESQKKAIESEIDEILKKVPAVAKPTFDTEEQLVEEIRAAEKEFNETGDSAEYQLKINDLNTRLENLVPAPEGAEIGEPSQDQKLKDIQEGNTVTFTYANESEVPDVLKDKISSVSETNGVKQIRVTLAKSEADYLLKPKEDAVSQSISSKVPVLTEATVGEEVEQGKPQPKDKVASEEGKEVVKSDGERIVYDREPTPDDGVYKILGDENNIIYRVNPNTGRIQEFSDGLWSNTPSNAIARGTARKNGFQKIKDPSSLTQEQTPAQEVKRLRAEEQAELKAAIPNADQYLTDGKVDRAKITDAKDLKKFDEIYDKYDKLITPLLPKSETQAGSVGVGGDVKQQELDAQKINKEAGVDVYVARQGVETNGEKYTLSQIKENGNTNTFVIEDANGSEIGKAQLSADGNYLENIRIDEKHRRKGLASKVYDFIELRKGIELEPSPNKQSKEAKALWDNRNLKKSVSNKANGGLLAKALGEAMSKTFADFKNKQQVLLELENKYFEQKGLSKEDFNKLNEAEKAEIIKDAVKWKNDNPELVKAVEQSLKETPQAGSVVGGDVEVVPLETVGEDIVYRGIDKRGFGGNGGGVAGLGKGLYTTNSKEEAQKYAWEDGRTKGKPVALKNAKPINSLVLNDGNVQKWIDENLPKSKYKNESDFRDNLSEYVTGLGYDGITIKSSDGVEIYVKYTEQSLKETKAEEVKSEVAIPKSFTSEGDNKVVDNEGNPLVVYHGTQSNFKDFEIPSNFGKVGYATSGGFEMGMAGGAIYFSSNEDTAKSYSSLDKRKKGRVIKSFIDIKKPYIIDAKGGNWTGRIADEYKIGLKNKDYDGVIVKNVIDSAATGGVVGDVYAVKSPSQIIQIAEPTPAKPKATKLKAKVDTRLKFKEVSDLSTKINEAVKGSAKRKRLIADRNLLLEKFPIIKYVYENIQNITKQLIQKGIITKDKDKVTYNGVNYSSDEFSSLLHDGLLDQLVKDKIIDDSNFVKKAEAIERTEFDSEEEAELYGISRETDPNVIAAKYFTLPTLEESSSPKDLILMEHFSGKRSSKINESDWAEYNDLNNLTPEIRKKYIDSTNKSGRLDTEALSYEENEGISFAPEDFIDFILDYGGAKGFKSKKVSNIQQALLERYFDLTGRKQITDAAAKKAFETVKEKEKAERERKLTPKEQLEEIGVTEEDIAKYEEFAKEGFGELETPLEKREFARNEKIRALKKEAENAENDLLSFVSKSRGQLGIGANVAEFAAKLTKVLKTYAELGIVTLDGVIDRLIEKAGKDFVDENIDAIKEVFNNFDAQKENIKEKAKELLEAHKELVKKAKKAIEDGVNSASDFAEYINENKTSEIEDAWREANDRGKKTSSDFKEEAEKLQAKEEKERLRQEDLGLVTPKLEDYESEEPIKVSNDFESLAYQAIESKEFRNTLSNKERESGRQLTRAEKRYQANPFMDSFELGKRIVAKAKEELGDTYVNDLLSYIAKNQNTLGVDKVSLIMLTLENDLNRQLQEDPDNLTLKKQENMVQNLAISYLRSAARAIGYGKLRQIARVGYDVDEVTSQLFSSGQEESRRKVVKAMQSTADEINNEAELQEQETEGELVIEEPKVKRDAKQVRADIKAVIAQMKADLVKSARGAGGALSAIPYAQQVKDVTPHIIKLSKLFAELGGMKTKEIVAEIRKSIKGLAPDVDETTITDILKEGKRILTEEQKRKNYIKSLEKDINDLDTQIEEKKRKVVSKEDKYKNDEEIQNLRDIKNGKKDLLNTLDPSYAERVKLKNDLNAAQRSLEEYERKIAENDFETAKKPIQQDIDSKLKELRDKRDTARNEYQDKKKAFEASLITPESIEEKNIDKAIKATEKSIAELERKLAEGDVTVTPKGQSPYSKQLGELKQKQAQLRDKLIEERNKAIGKSAPKDRLEQAKDRVNKRIEQLKEEIADKRKELKVVGKVKSDAELDSLLEQEKELKKIANQYLTQESIDRINESKEKSIVTKIENEIAKLDEQIANQQKLPKSSSSPVTSLEITLLKAQRKARIDVLNELDPNPKAFTKQALIDAGYSREITVTRKGGIKEKIQVLDWKKLAGNEMDVNAIKNIVEQALKDKGFTPAQISRMQDAFVNEFTELRASVIDKSLNTLRQMNEPKKVSERKSSAKRLAELFDFGLFNQDPDKFNYLLNKILGLSDLDQESFFELNKLSESIKEINLMKPNEFFTRQFIREINQKITKVLNKVARQQSNNWYKVANVVSELMNLGLRTKLLTLKQFFDNQISGRQERLIQDIGTMFQKGIDTKELKKLRSKYASLIKDDIKKNAGLYFGEVNSPFLTKSQIEDYINSRKDNQMYHLLVSIALGKSYLEGADSMNKAASTEKFFISMLLKVMTDKTNPNRMTPEDALKFVNEQLTGQKFEDALKESAKIINEINTKSGRVVLAETKENIFRGAMDLVKANLLVGQALDANSLKSAYNAAYKIAGYGLGHESNNLVTTLVNGFQSRIEEQIKKAVKEKQWGKAANLTIIATINRNILNPFVGGGTNWLVLGLQKSGIEPISPLYYMMEKMRNGIDLSTDSGVKKLEETLFDDYRRKTINKRLLIGGISSSLITLALFASGGDDEMEEWLKKNEWARKYQTVFVPQLTLVLMAFKNGTLGDWLTETFSKSQKFEKLPKIKKAIEAYNKGDSPEADKAKLYGVIGNVAGSFVDVPLLPVKFARDLGGVYKYIVDKPQEKPDYKNVGLANGFFNYGLIDYLGFRPDRTYMKNMEEYIPESDEKTIKFLRKNDLDINSNSDKAVLSNGIKKSLTEDEAQKYDNIWGKEAYRVIKEALADNEDMDETQIKSLKKVAEFTATRKAQSELDVDNSSLQELEMDGVKYSLTEAQINKRKALIKEYIRDNRDSEKFKDRYREAIKKGNIVGSAESKYFMLMESAKSSATRKMNDIYENKTSALEVIPK